jgi:hypothetical protein
MTDWINWNGGECPIKSDKTMYSLRFANGIEFTSDGREDWRWSHIDSVHDIIAYRIIDDHEPMPQTREQITAQIDALQKQLDALPVESWVYWGSGGYLYTHKELATVINGVPHIHGVAMKEVGEVTAHYPRSVTR